MVRLEKGSTLSQQQKKRSRSSLDYKKPKMSHHHADDETTNMMVPEYYDDLEKLSPAEIRELIKTHPELGSLVEQETPRLQQKYRDEETSTTRSSTQQRKQHSSSQQRTSTPRKKSKSVSFEEDREFPYVQWITLLLLLIATLLYVFFKNSNKNKKKKQQQPRKLRISEERLVQDTADVVVVPQPRPPKTKRSVKSHQRTKKVHKPVNVEPASKKSTTTTTVTTTMKTVQTTTMIETAEFEVGEWTTVGKKTKEDGRNTKPPQPVLVETIPENGSKQKKQPADNGESKRLNGKTSDPVATIDAVDTKPETNDIDASSKGAVNASNPEKEQTPVAPAEETTTTAPEQTPVADDTAETFQKPKSKKNKKKKKTKPDDKIAPEKTPLPETSTDNDAALAIQLQQEEERMADVAVNDTATTTETHDEWEEVTKKKTKKS